MPDPTDFWSRLKQVHVVRVLLVYLGASWVVLQVTQTIVQAFKMPDWVLPSAIIVLSIGLLVVCATAWVQSLAATTQGEESGTLPTDWEIAPRDAIASIRKGRLPHLTWGRTLAGGIVMLILLFAAAGSYVGLRRLHLAGPTPASAEAATGIAIVPFEVRGTGLDIWREGMMDLLSHEIDGVGGFRAIDSRTVLARWHDRVGDKPADEAMLLDVAKATGARYVLDGSVVAIGPSVRVITTVYDIATGKEVANAKVEGAADSVMQLADQLGVATVRSLLASVGRTGAADIRAETITTNSMPALRAYLEGEQHYRKGQFAEAVQSFEQAVAFDSTFAIALVELADSYGWFENNGSQRMVDVGKLAFSQRQRLSPRYQFIMTGWEALNRRSAEGIPTLKAAVRKYPDDARVWFLLADSYIHTGGASYRTDDELWEALQRATMLDPGFAPYLVHLAEQAIILHGDSVTARKALDRYATLTGSDEDLRYIRLAIPFVLGTEQEAAAAIKAVAHLPIRQMDIFLGTFTSRHDRFNRDASLDSVYAIATHTNRVVMQAWYAGTTGDTLRGNAAAMNPEVPPETRGQYAAYMYLLWNIQPPAGILEHTACPHTSPVCSVIIGAAYANMGRWADHEKLVRSLRSASAAETDSTRARILMETSEIVRATGLYRRGNFDAARKIFVRHVSEPTILGNQVRYELALLEANANHPAEALRNFNSIRNTLWRSAALLGSAMMHDQLGQNADARADYDHFFTLTSKGVQTFPAIAAARAAYARLQSKD